MDIWRRNSPCKSRVCDTLRPMQISHRHFSFALDVRSLRLVCCACSILDLSSQNSTPQTPQGTWTFSPRSQIRPRAIHLFIQRDLISYLINKALKCVTHESFRVFCVVRINGMLDNELVKFLCLIMNNLKEAFMAGSSKQGNARRASVGSNWVVAMLRNKTKSIK